MLIIPSVESKNFFRGSWFWPMEVTVNNPNQPSEVMMHWQLLDSRAFAAAAYSADHKILYLRFRSGELYRYFDVPSELYRDFLAADSHGQFFAHSIRDRFPFEHLTRIRKASAPST